ncbi:putative R-SNARE protein [Leptomonas seymouri]|uniref:Putative R-SNARE protein n=1 Tax=Leptomonas seymouri TaxID=5684 RepID=A0A0N1IMB1_LEPSE|nr:putative R-SNARE protein [Leptomonas seymouri]|eukprot:KPI89895.1 putative R-SNARE protein [Leptomonas seymouri]
MPINSSFVAFERNIVSEDNVSQSMRSALQKMLYLLPRHDSKVSYQYEQQVFHFLVENEIVYACSTSGQYENRVVFGFLIQVKDTFKVTFAGSADRYPRHSDLTQAKCQPFSSTLASSRKVFNEDPHTDKIDRIKDQLNTAREVMLQNLDSILERGERIDNLCDRTELLQEEAQGFHSNARSLKRAILIHNIKIIIGVVIFLGILALIIAFAACGIDFKKC